MFQGFEKFNKLISSFLIVLVILGTFSPFFAEKASAQWVVWDPGNFVPNAITAQATLGSQVKDFGLDAVAWVLVNLIIERISASTVKWINSGFKGSPAFITDPESYFKDLGDKVAGQYIFSNPNLNFLCSSFNARIKIVLAQNYLNQRVWRCSLSDVAGNVQDFMNDFDKGGWDKFFRLTQEKQNNPIGAYIQAEGELFEQIANKTQQKQQELNWGQGFLSFKTCPPGKKYGEVNEGADGSGNWTSSEGDDVLSEDTIDYLNSTNAFVDPNTCTVPMTVNTPGSVISNQLNTTLHLGNDRLQVADEINELVSALLNQLVGKIIGGIGSGLRSLSKPDSSNGNKTFVDKLLASTATSTTDYFGNTQKTTILETTLPDPNAGVPTNPLYPTSGGSTPFCDPNDKNCICQNDPTDPICQNQ